MANPNKIVTVSVDANGNATVTATHTEGYTDPPTVKMKRSGETVATPVATSSPLQEAQLDGSVTTRLSLIAPLPAGPNEVTVTCSGANFVTTIARGQTLQADKHS